MFPISSERARQIHPPSSGDSGASGRVPSRGSAFVPKGVPIAIGMNGTYRDTLSTVRVARSTGSIREKRPGYWEVRVVVATRPTVQRSFAVRGTRSTAETRRDELVAEFGVDGGFASGAILSVGDLVKRFVDGPHLWKLATVNSHRSVTRFLVSDKVLANVALTALTPSVAVAAIRRWKHDGASDPTISARWLVLRGSLSRATAEGLIRRNPLLGMRGPARPEPRMHLTIDEIHRLLAATGRLGPRTVPRGTRERELAP